MTDSTNYYDTHLSAEKLKRCYEIAPSRVRQYLDAEVNHVLKYIKSGDNVVELGCGYGRIIPLLAKKSIRIFGIDTSQSSLLLARENLKDISNCYLSRMNAVQLTFTDKFFNSVVCIQNGISAFHVDQQKLIHESVRVTKRGGVILFSTYSEKFWKHRLQWFQLQSEAGLLGEIDYDKTGNGTIICKDGFTATTVSAEQFKRLASHVKQIRVTIEEVDESSLFCIIERQ
ncbi:MAG: methyltransferase domain-containing protein [Ignavibacteriae bacterium]|nr:methyltransferase domain-containing protein [Ignavibacteriota bacterium]